MTPAEFDASWQRAWRGLGARGEGHALRDRLLACYGQAQRHYHTRQHLGECLQAFAEVQALPAHPHEVEIALWFHDAVYELQRHDNEARSAEWAQAALTEAGVAAEAAGRVQALILDTRHTAAPQGHDANVLVDIDLAILGAPAARFAEYERQIRAEYAFVPQPLFDEKRRAVLQGFLARPRLFGTDHFHARLDARARANLRGAIGR